MYCESCGSFISDGQAFCSNCGAPAPSSEPAPGPAAAQPVYAQPVQPVFQQPVYEQPVYQQPVYQQPVYQQPVYQQPVYPQQVIITQMPRERVRINGAATTGLVFGIISLVCFWIPAVGQLPAFFGLLFSIIGVAKKNAGGKGRAIAGLIMSGIALITGIFIIIMAVSDNYYN